MQGVMTFRSPQDAIKAGYEVYCQDLCRIRTLKGWAFGVIDPEVR